MNRPSNKPLTARLTLRALIDYIMGGIIGLVGLFFLLRGEFPSLPANRYLGEPDRTDLIFGILCLLYAGWRIIRGRKKNKEQ
jgi:hypothetical protein